MQNNDAIGIQLSAILRRLRGDTKTQRHIRHGKYDNPVTGGDVIRDSAQRALQNVVSVQERHLRLRFEPYLVLGVGGEQVEGLDGEMEAAAVGVLADAGAERDKVGTGDVGGALDERFAGIEYPVLVEAEAVAARVGVRALVRGVFDDILEVVSDEFEELLEHYARLLLI